MDDTESHKVNDTESHKVVESTLAVVLARARSTINEWFAEAERLSARTVGDAENEASDILARARTYARRIVDEATAEADEVRPAAEEGDSAVDARAILTGLDGLAETVADVLSAIDQTVAIAGVMAGRITGATALPPGTGAAGQLGRPADEIAAEGLERSVNRLFAAVEDMLHSLEELREAAEGATPRRPPWETD